jgi:hypothetical protein
MTTPSKYFTPYFQPEDVLFLIKQSGSIGWSWGIEKIQYHSPSLSIFVNGFIHRGRVQISVSWKDLYHIEFYNTDEKWIKTIEDIYVDELISVLDKEIERGDISEEEYKSNVEKVSYHLN